MAIDDKKYDTIHDKTGDEKNALKAKFDEGHINVITDNADMLPEQSAMVYQIGQIQEELDYLRGLISDNKDKTTFPGFGTSGSTCLAGNTTTITTAQGKEITANTAKTGITTEQAKAITLNTAKTGISDSQADAITTNTAKVSFPVTYAAEGHSLSFAVDKNGTALTITNTYTDPETEKSKLYTTTIKLS